MPVYFKINKFYVLKSPKADSVSADLVEKNSSLINILLIKESSSEVEALHFR
jgi:hypothetical protein